MQKALKIIMLVTLGGCAATPSSIQPSSVSRIPYTTMGCKNLEISLTQERRNLEESSDEQRSLSKWNAALNYLSIIPGISGLTEDWEDEIAQSKGKIIAMQDEFTARCVEGS